VIKFSETHRDSHENPDAEAVKELQLDWVGPTPQSGK